MKRGLGARGWGRAGFGLVGAMLAVALFSAASRQPQAPSQTSCPRAAVWAAIRDSTWPLVTHVDGDEVFAHLEPAGLPGQSATWCNPLQNDSQAVAAGQQLYGTWCASCHGDLGKGDGPGAAQASPTPFDFSRPEFAGMREAPGPGVLYAIVTNGIGGTMMRGFGDQLGGWERLALMAYITRFPGPDAVGRSRAWADTLRARKH